MVLYSHIAFINIQLSYRIMSTWNKVGIQCILTLYRIKTTYLLHRLDFVERSAILTVEPLVTDDLAIKLQTIAVVFY